MVSATKCLLYFLVFAVIWNIGISTYHTGHPLAFLSFRGTCFTEFKTLEPGKQTFLVNGYEDVSWGRIDGVHITSIFNRDCYWGLEYSYGCYDLDEGTRYIDDSWLFWLQIKLGLRKQFLEVIKNVSNDSQDIIWTTCSTYY